MRQTGSAGRRRYERKECAELEETIFWALDLKCLTKREAEGTPVPAAPAQKQPKQTAHSTFHQREPQKTKSQQEPKHQAAKPAERSQPRPCAKQAAPALQKQLETPNPAPRPKDDVERMQPESLTEAPRPPEGTSELGGVKASAATDLPPPKDCKGAPAGQTPDPLTQAPAQGQAQVPAQLPAQLPVRFQRTAPVSAAENRAKDAQEGARGTILSFSQALQEQLARGLAAGDKATLDSSLNMLRMDSATRGILLRELQVRPGMAASQLEQLVTKAFKTKVNMLRSVGLRVIRTVLEDAMPDLATRFPKGEPQEEPKRCKESRELKELEEPRESKEPKNGVRAASARLAGEPKDRHLKNSAADHCQALSAGSGSVAELAPQPAPQPAPQLPAQPGLGAPPAAGWDFDFDLLDLLDPVVCELAQAPL